MFQWLRRITNYGRTVARYIEGESVYPFYIRRSAAGEVVTRETALTVSAYFRCMNYISGQIAQMPWRVRRALPGGGFEPIPNHPVTRLLSVRPMGDDGPALIWRRMMVWRAIECGNAYAEIQRNAAGTPVALWPIHPDRVKVERDGDGLIYEVRNGRAGDTILTAREVFHLRGFGGDLVGRSLIEFAADSIGWARATELFGASYFASGMAPAMIIKLSKAMTPEAAQQFRWEFSRTYGGANGERVLILDQGKEAEPFPISAEAGQFIETRGHQVLEMCRFLGVPPHIVFDMSKASFANVENMNLSIVSDTLGPWMTQLEQEATAKLLRAADLETVLDETALLKGDQAARSNFLREMIMAGVINRNEARAREGLPPIDGGNDYLIPANMKNTTEPAANETQEPTPTKTGPGSDVDPGAGGRPEE